MKSNRPYTENAFIINPKTVGREQGAEGGDLTPPPPWGFSRNISSKEKTNLKKPILVRVNIIELFPCLIFYTIRKEGFTQV